MTMRHLLILAACALLPATAHADGFVLDRAGRYVPETEQQAYIERHDGREHLYLATRTQQTNGPSL
jgi:hypothetical protein